jgi:hypothetical protein
MKKILRFTFQGEQGLEDIKADLALAIFAAECLHVRPRVRLETRYLVGPGGQACVMEVSGPAGESVAQVFAGLIAARLGEEAVSISYHQEQLLDVGHHGS